MRVAFLIALLVFANVTYAGGWLKSAKVDRIELVRGQGFMIIGDFGNPANCRTAGWVLVETHHPQYDAMLSLALAAFMSGKKLKGYSHNCVDNGWHGGNYNVISPSGSLMIEH